MARRRGGKGKEVSQGDQFGRDRINSVGREKRKGENRGEEKQRKKEEEKGKREIFRRSDSQSLTVRELKLIHATRATREYQNQGVLSNSKR